MLPLVLAAIGGAWVIALVWFAAHRYDLRRADATAMSPLGGGSGELPVLWNAPSFSAVDQQGHDFGDEALRGHVWIADFVFTRCTTACPIISAKMLLLRKAIDDASVRFVSFTVDPEFDTPAVLADYARRWNGDDRWRLLRTRPEDVQAVARGFKVPVERTGDAVNPILHTTLFFLVDGAGRVRGIYDSVDDDAVQRLIVDAKRLADVNERGAEAQRAAPQAEGRAVGRQPAGTQDEPLARSDVDRGHALYESVGCAGCHADARIAPPLTGIVGQSVLLQGGAVAKVDDAYLRESIVEPNARIVAGYGSPMPSYQGRLTDRQVADVVAYVRSLSSTPSVASAGASAAIAEERGPHGAELAAREAHPTGALAMATSHGQAAATPTRDPVCGMQVQPAEATAHTQYNGKTYYFCSDTCLERFSKTPEKYAPHD